ncbi:MAG: MFS transporter [Candidatus Bathyarchaeia archaeon]
MAEPIVAALRKYVAVEGIVALVATQFLFTAGISIWNPYLNIYFSSIGLSGLDIGLVSTLQSAVSSLTMLPAGIIADRVGRKRPILFGFALSFGYSLGLIVLRDYCLILLLACIQGVGAGLRLPAVSAYILDVVPERRGAAFATFHFFELLAMVSGTAAGAPLSKVLGYQAAFLTGAALILASGVFAFAKLKESMLPAKREPGRSASVYSSFKDGIALMGQTSILLLIAGSVVHQVATSFAIPYLGLYLSNVLVLDLVLVGVLMNARQIGDIFGQLPSGRLIDRFSAEVVLFLHVFLTAPIVYFFGANSDPYVLFLILLIWGSEAGWDIPSRRLLIARYSSGTGSATALGAVQSFIGLIALPSPAIGGWIWDNLGPPLLFQMSALVNAVACIPLVVLVWRARRGEEAKTRKG